MAKDKTDYSKLTLGKKKPLKREEKKLVEAEKVDKIVEEIHNTEPKEPKKENIPTKRITLDIPVPLHRRVRNRAYDLDITMKKYSIIKKIII